MTVLSKDQIPVFVPERKPRVVILGTMAAICARNIDGVIEAEEPFYYHNDKKNRFWGSLEKLFEPGKSECSLIDVSEKKAFLEKHRIAMSNLVHQIEVEKERSRSALDEVLFEAQCAGFLKFKEADDEFQLILKSTPVLLTCRLKTKKIRALVGGYLEFNKMNASLMESILGLRSPARPLKAGLELSDLWRSDVQQRFPDLLR